MADSPRDSNGGHRHRFGTDIHGRSRGSAEVRTGQNAARRAVQVTELSIYNSQTWRWDRRYGGADYHDEVLGFILMVDCTPGCLSLFLMRRTQNRQLLVLAEANFWAFDV